MRHKKITIFVSLLVIVVIVFFFFRSGEKSDITTLNETTMTLSSPTFDSKQNLPDLYTCRGTGNPPPLEIGGVPANTASLVLVVHDPDAPSGDFTHWLVWNITPETREIGDILPSSAVEGENSVGQVGYISPCPPAGTHRYYFQLYALDIKIDLPSAANRIELEKAIKDHILDQAELIGLVEARAQ